MMFTSGAVLITIRAFVTYRYTYATWRRNSPGGLGRERERDLFNLASRKKGEGGGMAGGWR